MFEPRILIGALALSLSLAPASFVTRSPLHAQSAATLAPPGTYGLDVTHSTVSFKVSHLGLSGYVANFDKLGGELKFDPANPSAMSVTATIDPKSLDIPAPPAGFLEKLIGQAWLDTAAHPEIRFQSTSVTRTGDKTADVAGELTIKGVTKPVVLKATFNGGWPASPMGVARVGFSATTSFKRSDFGVRASLPPPGTNLGVGDVVDVVIETEWELKR